MRLEGLGKTHQIRSKYSTVPPSALLLLHLQSLMFSPLQRCSDHFLISPLVSFLSLLFTPGAASFLLWFYFCLFSATRADGNSSQEVSAGCVRVHACARFLFNTLWIVQLNRNITENTGFFSTKEVQAKTMRLMRPQYLTELKWDKSCLPVCIKKKEVSAMFYSNDWVKCFSFIYITT